VRQSRSLILDEVGMTDDAYLARLAAYTELAGAKMVLTGEHRQLGSVGPGGALGALVKRHPEAVHYLSENRRQRDPGERQALEALRDGDVGEAVSWYVEQGRVHPVPTRDGALRAAAEAWAADMAAGHETGLYAWRRANVAELNRHARAWMEAAGRLTGPELAGPGGAVYRAGDRVVTLAPGPRGSLVTSERATVELVDATTGSLRLRTDDGRLVRVSGVETGADRLALRYATTVHRSQGSTVARAHLFADGGGRELAYVAMSRASQCTHAWLVADDVGQAADDLRRDWCARRTPTWALDIGLPGDAEAIRELGPALAMSDRGRVVAIAHAQSKVSSYAIKCLERPDGRAGELGEARAALARAEHDLSDLQAGDGAYCGTEAGRAVSNLARARAGLTRARWEAEHSPRWRQRRAAAKESAAVAAQLADAEGRWQAYVAPEVARLEAAIYAARQDVDGLVASQEREARWARLAQRGHTTGRAADRLASGLARYREVLNGEKAQAPTHGRRLGQREPWLAPAHTWQPVGHDSGPEM
jgi:hypothetical protein